MCPMIRSPHLIHSLSLLAVWSRLAFVRLDGMKHDLVRVVRGVVRIALAPVVAHGVRKDSSRGVEVGCRNSATNLGVALQAMLGVLVPEVEGTVAACGAEGAVDGME